jgi:chromosome segregation protein
VFLKSLTLRGFKSFPAKTHLAFEPGVTVIVGPNGSGKSNLVDALAWVLGTHSPKSLRGGQMADVIFVGAPGKPALGWTSVEITIDNSSGLLPIEFSEVTISRSMFATGENDYAINGTECRLLDVQELLSDTGLGRETHSIVGQGQLEAVLNARPEERRAFVEEAAGILKHRRRKERALRKLVQTEAHLERLQDVLRELRRSLRPLERQAEAAAKHAELLSSLRRVRLARALRAFHGLSERRDQEQTARRDVDDRLGVLEATQAATRTEEQRLEELLDELAPSAQAAAETHFHLANLVERYRGLAERIEERRLGLLEAVEEPVAGRDPAELRARAAEEREVLATLIEEQASARRQLAAAEGDRRAAEHARRAHEQAAAAEARRRAEARERLLRWEGELAALRGALAQAASEEGRLDSQWQGLQARQSELDRDVAAVQEEIRCLDAQGAVLADQLAAAETAVTRRQAVADRAARKERDLERQRASLEARIDALVAASQDAADGMAALTAAAEAGEISGLLGPLADHVRVRDGMAKAVSAALGPLGDALVVRSRAAAREAVGFAKSRKTGRVLLVVADHGAADSLKPGVARPGTAEPDVPDRPAPRSALEDELASLGARHVTEALRADAFVLEALRRALTGVYLVPGGDFDAACALAASHPELAFVTPDGDVAGVRGYAGGSTGPNGAVFARAAAEQAQRQLDGVSDELLMAHRQLADADRDLQAARRELDAATAAMQESDGLITAAAERLKRLRKEHETCARELAQLAAQREDHGREVTALRERLAELEARGPTRSGGPGPPAPVRRPQHEGATTSGHLVDEGPDLEAERLDDRLTQAREREVQARLTTSALEQRGGELGRRIEALVREADDVERQLAEREQRRVQRIAAIARCDELAVVAATGLRRTEESLRLAAAERDQVDASRGARQGELGVVRARLRELEEQLGALRDERHTDDLRLQKVRHEADAVRARLREEFGLDPDAALADARARRQPEGEAPGVEEDVLAGGDERDAALADEEERLVRKVALLGTVNPLALEEHAALEERHRFLAEQLDDMRRSRRDLEHVIRAVDDRIRELFAAAFADVAFQFEAIFPRLFPGGHGRLVLTDPGDLLNTGVDVEARPPGKRIKRLSLLSGGERSLTALAVLFAIFAARPSPFYVLDEVEAALDDVNLQRFLAVVKDFRAMSQFLIVTHQKRTMEIADLLYGVSMHGNGVSKVVSQRMTEPTPA